MEQLRTKVQINAVNDVEINAILLIRKILEDFEQEEINRILSYVCSREGAPQ